EQLERYETKHELDFGYTVKDAARFRFNVYMQRGSVAGALRAIPTKIPPFESLGLPQIVREMCKRTSGLILVTGPTGSGKTTTIASMIDDINATRPAHILTIEDPIEYLHRHQKCMINQRELNIDTYSLHDALRAVLREDPDIVLVGELRDLETIEAALTIAETGHICYATLHTNSAVQTINRVLDVFPPYQQPQVRAQLSFVLEGVMSQALVSKVGGPGRVLALEVMIPNPAIRNLIREDKVHQIYSSMQVGQAKYGMQTFNQALAALLARRLISQDEAFGRSSDPEELRNILATGGGPGGAQRPAGGAGAR
ncbi:MAG: PilT/PilU family type 4a pilus ATPase, partial [Myxococcaceae bacterium]